MPSRQNPSKADKRRLRSHVVNGLKKLDKSLTKMVKSKERSIEEPRGKVYALKFAKKTILGAAKKWSRHVETSLNKGIKHFSKKM